MPILTPPVLPLDPSILLFFSRFRRRLTAAVLRALIARSLHHYRENVMVLSMLWVAYRQQYQYLLDAQPVRVPRDRSGCADEH